MLNTGVRKRISKIKLENDVIDASFDLNPSSNCSECGLISALRLPAVSCPFFDRTKDRTTMTKQSSLCSVDLVRAVEENLPSYYEHLSVSLLAPETPDEETPSPRRRRREKLITPLPLPDNMTPIGDFLDGVVAYVEVRSDLGDHSGAIGALLYRMGAAIASSLSPFVTHAVLSSAKASSIRKAKEINAVIVAARWAMACKDQLRRVEEEDWPMLDSIHEKKRLRTYRYKASGVNEVLSPISVRNLALLSKSRNGLTYSPGKRCINKGPPRKSLRRLLFTQDNTVPETEAFSDIDSDLQASFQSIPETQEVDEVPETQPPFLYIPETHPSQFGESLPDVDRLITENEIPETEAPNEHNADRSISFNTSTQVESDGKDDVSSEKQTVVEHMNFSGMSLTEDLEISFNSMTVGGEVSQNELLETSGLASENVIIMENRNHNLAVHDGSVCSQGALMELTKALNGDFNCSLHRRQKSSADISMVFTQPLENNQLMNNAHDNESSLVDQTSETKTPPLELILPSSQASSAIGLSDTTRNSRLFLRSPSEVSSASNKYPRNTAVSEEIGQHWSFQHSETNQSKTTESFPFTLCDNNTISEEKESFKQTKKRTSPLKECQEVTPFTDKLRIRTSGTFSDDNSPCVDSKRTVVLTSLSDKKVIANALKQLARKKNLPFSLELAKEVTTRTEVVVVGKYKRTLSVLLGIAWGCWFVSEDWALESIREGRWLDPAPFEIQDFLEPMVLNRKLRTGHRKDVGRPLQGVNVFISRKATLKPSADSIQRMVLQSGGKVVFDPRHAEIYVGLSRPLKKVPCICVHPSWVVETISLGQKQCSDQFKL